MVCLFVYLNSIYSIAIVRIPTYLVSVFLSAFHHHRHKSQENEVKKKNKKPFDLRYDSNLGHHITHR